MKQLAVITVIMTAALTLSAASGIPVIPEPQSVKLENGAFELNAGTVLYSPAILKNLAGKLVAYLKPALGKSLSVSVDSSTSKNSIILSIDSSLLKRHGKEAYAISVTRDIVHISGGSPAGVFYGIQTLRQFLPPDTIITNKDLKPAEIYKIPCLKVLDYPRFKWRGLMIDPCRHFFPVKEIKRMLDVMALLKINVLHWHLTEDQGWRIEIKKYPKLTEAASVRAESPKLWHRREGDGKQYGPYFYTQEQVKDIVKYAGERFITVVPEIEMPGHSIAALAAYPELGCTGGPYKVRTRWGVEPNIYCAGNEKVFKFLQDVLSEVMQIFPSEFIHVGGDEAPKSVWKRCPKCQKRIKDEGLKNEHELQSYFIQRMDKFLASHGRRLIGWDEILEGGLAPGAAVMSWRGEKGGINAAKMNHDVVMSPTAYCYLDYYEAKGKVEPEAIGGFLPLSKVYSYNPVPNALSPGQAKHILGLQGNLWSEYIWTPDQLEYKAFPRACAIAEVGWTEKDRKNYNSFMNRLGPFLQRLKYMGINYRQPDMVIGEWNPSHMSETFKTLSWDITGKVNRPGKYSITFQYKKGKCRLDINKVSILEDTKILAEDAHAGTTGAANKGNTYILGVSTLKQNSKYILTAEVRSDGGMDSYGKITLKIK